MAIGFELGELSGELSGTNNCCDESGPRISVCAYAAMCFRACGISTQRYLAGACLSGFSCLAGGNTYDSSLNPPSVSWPDPMAGPAASLPPTRTRVDERVRSACDRLKSHHARRAAAKQRTAPRRLASPLLHSADGVCARAATATGHER